MEAHATYDDVNLVLHLYELRREEKMREARKWFAASFKADTPEELQELCPDGSEPNAHYRMVVSYWEMVASFITSGVLHEELFFQSGMEMLAVWVKIRELVPKHRELSKNPAFLGNLETVANRYIKWMQERAPEAYAAFAIRIRKEQ